MDRDRSNIDLVKERTDIVSVVQRYVQLKNAGKNYSGLCPFHQEKTPSFNVSPQLQIYKCFGCGKSGDVINFLQEIEKIDFQQALERLAKEAGVTLTLNTQPISVAMQINQWAKSYYQKELLKPMAKTALAYLNNRGIDKKLIEDFGIGFASGDGKFLKDLLNYRNYSKKILLNSGLFIERNGALKEKFNKRIMFPILNTSGHVIAFTGRKLPDNEYGPKYLNSPESSIYQKRNSLYGLYQAKASIKKEDLCIILEGTTDVIAMHKIGITNTVAPLGTGLTESQLQIISNYTKNILFLFDSDAAGQAALERSFQIAASLSLTSFATNTGQYKDIDELIQKAPNDAKKLVENRTDAFTYLLLNKIEQLGTESLKSLKEIRKYILDKILPVSDETERNFYLNTAKNLVSQISLPKIESSAKKKSDTYAAKKHFSIEDLYLAAILESPKVALDHELSINHFVETDSQALYKLLTENIGKDIKELYNIAHNNPRLQSYITLLSMYNGQEINKEEIKQRLIKSKYEKDLANTRILLAIAEKKEDTNKVKILLQQAQELSDKLKQIKK